MSKNRLTTASSLFALVLVCTSLHTASSAASNSTSQQSPAHLYVVDNNRAVYRFPLAQDGLPSTKPDGVMYPQGAVYPQGIAVDNVGHIFIADPNGWGGAVAEFAAGAVGREQPISILNLGGDHPDRLKLDDEQRLYVHYNKDQDIAIFAKGAHGNDAPLSVVHPTGAATDYLIAASGALFVLNDTVSVGVYNDPLHSPTRPDWSLTPDGFFEFSSTFGIDESSNRLYIQFYVPNTKYWNKLNYDVRSTSLVSVPNARAPQWLFTGDCGSTQAVDVGGTVIVKNYLIVSCNSNSDVLVYRTNQFGRQGKPVEIVGQEILSGNWDIAVGP